MLSSLLFLVTSATAQNYAYMEPGDSIVAVRNQEKKYGFYDKIKKKEIVAPVYDEVTRFEGGLAAVKLNYKWGFVDQTGNLVIPLQYDMTPWFYNGFAAVSLNRKYGFIDKTGKTIVPFIYDYASSFSEEVACVRIGKKNGYINKEVIALIFLNCP